MRPACGRRRTCPDSGSRGVTGLDPGADPFPDESAFAGPPLGLDDLRGSDQPGAVGAGKPCPPSGLVVPRWVTDDPADIIGGERSPPPGQRPDDGVCRHNPARFRPGASLRTRRDVSATRPARPGIGRLSPRDRVAPMLLRGVLQPGQHLHRTGGDRTRTGRRRHRDRAAIAERALGNADAAVADLQVALEMPGADIDQITELLAEQVDPRRPLPVP